MTRDLSGLLSRFFAALFNLSAKFARLVLCVVLLNAPYWILADKLFLARATFSLDSLIALLLLQFSLTWGAAAIAVSWLTDLIVSLSLTYHFASPVEFVRSLQFANRLDLPGYLASSANLVFAIPFLVAAWALKRVTKQRLGAWPVVALTFALITLDALNGSSALSKQAIRVFGTNIAGSSWYALGRAALDDSRNAQAPLTHLANGGKDEVLQIIPTAFQTDRGFLFVIVESFGVHESSAIRHWLIRQLLTKDLNGIYEMTAMEVGAIGGTTAGELRRLCALSGNYQHLTLESAELCLPRQLQADGWATHGYHGFSSGMFARQHWWPLIGITDVHFAEDLSLDHPGRCGAAFKGICDSDLIAAAVHATQSPKSFVYALTLNTHLPLSPVEPSTELASLCLAEKANKDVCALLAHLGITLRALSSSLMHTDLPPYVLLAGDHPPPFIEKRSRDQFKRGLVPMFGLSPRSASQTPAGGHSHIAPASSTHARSEFSE